MELGFGPLRRDFGRLDTGDYGRFDTVTFYFWAFGFFEGMVVRARSISIALLFGKAGLSPKSAFRGQARPVNTAMVAKRAHTARQGPDDPFA